MQSAETWQGTHESSSAAAGSEKLEWLSVPTPENEDGFQETPTLSFFAHLPAQSIIFKNSSLVFCN